MYTLILADGTKLPELERNGDCFYSKKKVDESIFVNNLSTLTITGGETEEVMINAVLIRQVQRGNKWRLAFRELTTQEIKEMSVMGKIDYLAMMADIDLEEV